MFISVYIVHFVIYIITNNIHKQHKQTSFEAEKKQVHILTHADVNRRLNKHWSQCWTIYTAYVVELYGDAEALSHCSCCYCQDHQGSFSARVFTSSKCTEWNHQVTSLFGDCRPSVSHFETLQDRPMRPELLWTRQPMTQGKGQNKVSHWQRALHGETASTKTCSTRRAAYQSSTCLPGVLPCLGAALSTHTSLELADVSHF